MAGADHPVHPVADPVVQYPDRLGRRPQDGEPPVRHRPVHVPDRVDNGNESGTDQPSGRSDLLAPAHSGPPSRGITAERALPLPTGARPAPGWPRGRNPTAASTLTVMAKVVLRVRLMAGDRLDVTYEEDGITDADEVLERAIAALSDDTGMIRARHGDRMVVVYGRGVAALEVAPRGAIL